MAYWTLQAKCRCVIVISTRRSFMFFSPPVERSEYWRRLWNWSFSPSLCVPVSVSVYTMTHHHPHVSYTTGMNGGALLWKLLHWRRYTLSQVPSSITSWFYVILTLIHKQKCMCISLKDKIKKPWCYRDRNRAAQCRKHWCDSLRTARNIFDYIFCVLQRGLAYDVGPLSLNVFSVVSSYS